jgi:hypothetical protein
MKKTNDVSQSPITPQYQVGATSDEAVLNQEITKSPLEGPGGIVSRLAAQQWSMPRNSPDANISRDSHAVASDHP